MKDTKIDGVPSAALLKSKLGKTLLLWFLLLSLVPLLLISYNDYFIMKDSLIGHTKESFSELVNIESELIQSTFNRYIVDARTQADNTRNSEFLQKLEDAFKRHHDSGKSLAQFIKTPQWEVLDYENGENLKDFKKKYGYHDILMADIKGNILYSISRESDLGTNILTGKYSETVLASACLESLKTGRTVFSDYGFYGPSGGKICGFIVDVILDDMGEKMGIIVLQLPTGNIDELLGKHVGNEDSKDIYLIGVDLKLRTNSLSGKAKTILGDPIDTVQTRSWHDAHGSADRPLECSKEAPHLYSGYMGHNVYGTHKTIDILGKRFGLIAEIPESKLMAPVVNMRNMSSLLLIISVIAVLVTAFTITWSIVRPINSLANVADRIAGGDLEQCIDIRAKNEVGTLAESVKNMLDSLRKSRDRQQKQDWLKTGIAKLNQAIAGDLDTSTLASRVISEIPTYLEAQIGAIYLADDTNPDTYSLQGSFAYKKRKDVPMTFKRGEGLVGQAVQEKRQLMITDIPETYVRISSGLGERIPKCVCITPLMREGAVKGVVEIGMLNDMTASQQEYLRQAMAVVAIAVETAQSREILARTLEESQTLSEELQAQQEELQAQQDELLAQRENVNTFNDDRR